MPKKKKNLKPKRAKAEKKNKKSNTEELMDLEGMLEDFKNQEIAKYTVSEESDSGPPSRRSGATLCTNPLNPTELIMVGGEFFDGQIVHLYNSLMVYNTEKNEWKQINSPNSPGPRSSHQSVCTNNGSMFLFGGEYASPNESNFFHYKDFWVLDLKTYAWEKLEIKGKPSPRSGHRMTLWKHFLVLFGGFFEQVHEKSNPTKYLDDLFVFDTQTFQWTQINTPEPRPSPRSGCQLMTHNDEVILYGGYSKVATKGKKTTGMMHVDSWSLKMNLDPTLIKWERKKKAGGGNTPGQRSGCTTVYHKGKAILFGGVSDIVENEETIESIMHSDALTYQLDSNKWYPLHLKRKDDTLAPGPRFNAAMCVSRNHLYMYGGILELGQKEFTRSDFWCLNLDKLVEWTQLVEDASVEIDNLVESSSDDDSSGENDAEVESEESESESESEEDDNGDAIVEEIKPLEDPEMEPKPMENKNDYFHRTSIFWQNRALESTAFTGKVLRRVAFRRAETRFAARLPQNQIIEAEMIENEVKAEVAREEKRNADTKARNR